MPSFRTLWMMPLALLPAPRVLWLMPLSMLNLTFGCWRPDAATKVELSRGAIWLMPGIEGGPSILKDAVLGIRDAGVDQAIFVFDWERVFGLSNLMDHDGNRRKAAQIASEVLAYRAAYPDQTIDLVGYSGGGGMAVFVAEALPPDVRLRNIVLCQPALSPTYDLTEALTRLEGRLVNLHSPMDWFILGAGTSVFGTMDRRNVTAAGRFGFDVEAAAPPALRNKITQISWDKEMLRQLHLGGHAQIISRTWNHALVAPWLQLPTDVVAVPATTPAPNLSAAAPASPSSAETPPPRP